jgi:hypothetical protein
VITICDTGPLVARNDPYHSWAVALMKQARSPMLTTEPVLTGVAYSLRADHVDVDPMFQLLERDASLLLLLLGMFGKPLQSVPRYKTPASED